MDFINLLIGWIIPPPLPKYPLGFEFNDPYLMKVIDRNPSQSGCLYTVNNGETIYTEERIDKALARSTAQEKCCSDNNHCDA